MPEVLKSRTTHQLAILLLIQNKSFIELRLTKLLFELPPGVGRADVELQVAVEIALPPSGQFESLLLHFSLTLEQVNAPTVSLPLRSILLIRV